MTNISPQVKAAVVQAAPILFDCDATVEKTCRLTVEATAQGAQLIFSSTGLSQRVETSVRPHICWLSLKTCYIWWLMGELRLPKKWVAKGQPVSCTIFRHLWQQNHLQAPYLGDSRFDPLRKPHRLRNCNSC